MARGSTAGRWRAGPAAGQGLGRRPPSTVYPETDGSTEALIRTATAHVRQGQWEAAIELYQRALQRSPEALTALRDAEDGGEGEGIGLFVNVSEYAQRELAQLPPEALRAYRARVDGEARHYFEEGRDRLDEDALRRVVDTFFCSGSGDDATELLADLAFQDGRFEEARALYGRLVAIGDDGAGALVYPDPDVDVARVAAKALLTAARPLDEPPSDALLAEFAERYPDAERRPGRPRGALPRDPGRGTPRGRPRAAADPRRPLADLRRGRRPLEGRGRAGRPRASSSGRSRSGRRSTRPRT